MDAFRLEGRRKMVTNCIAHAEIFVLQSRPTSVLTSCFRRGVTPDFLESDRTRLRAPNEESESQESTPMKESTLLG